MYSAGAASADVHCRAGSLEIRPELADL